MGKRKRAIIKGYKKYKSKYARVAAAFNKAKLDSATTDELPKERVVAPTQEPSSPKKTETEEVEKIAFAEVTMTPEIETKSDMPAKPKPSSKPAKPKKAKGAPPKKKTKTSWLKNAKSKKKSPVKEA